MLWLSIKATASCRICAQSRSPGRTGRGQARALPFPLLTLRGSLEARRVLKKKPPVQPAPVPVTELSRSGPEEHTELNSPRGGGFHSLSSRTADGHVEALVRPLRARPNLSHSVPAPRLSTTFPTHSAPLCASCPASLRDPRPNPRTASPPGRPLSTPCVPPHCTGGAPRQLRC